MPVLFLLSGPKMFFAPRERHVAPINVKFGMGERTAILGAVSHILKVTITVKLCTRVGPATPSFTPNFLFFKLLKGIYLLGGNLYQKIPILATLAPVSPHLKSHNHEVWREGMDLGHPPPRLIL